MLRNHTNLVYLTRLHSNFLPRKNEWKYTDEAMKFRNEYVERHARAVFSDAEIDQVLTNRRSDRTDEALIKDFMTTDLPHFEIPFDSNVENAIKVTAKQFKPHTTLHPVHFPDLRYYPFSLSVSAEAPWTSPTFRFKPTGRNVDAETGQPKLVMEAVQPLPHVNGHVLVNDYLKVKQKLGLIKDESTSFHNLYNEIFSYNRPLIHQIKEGDPAFWNSNGTPKTYHWRTLHARAHVVSQDEPDKVRSVFGETKLSLQTELPFAWPLQASYLNTDSGRMLWGREMSRGGWRKLFTEMHKNGPPNTVLSADWSAFDKRLLHQLIRIAFMIIRSYFDFSKYEPVRSHPQATPGEEIRLERLWNWMVNSVLHTPILLPNGELFYWSERSFGSGAQFTQIIDTLCNSLMLNCCLRALGVNIESEQFWIRLQGDDSIICFMEHMFKLYGNDFLVQLANAAKYYFDAILNVKKSEISNKVSGMTVLSYKNLFGIAQRSDEDLLRHLFFPERPQDLGRLAASSIGLAIASLGCSPRFYHLCRLIWNKLVIEKGVKPKWKALQWMVRAGMFETLDQLKFATFPSLSYLRSMAYDTIERSEAEKARQWPTRNLPREKFYFLRPT